MSMLGEALLFRLHFTVDVSTSLTQSAFDLPLMSLNNGQ